MVVDFRRRAGLVVSSERQRLKRVHRDSYTTEGSDCMSTWGQLCLRFARVVECLLTPEDLTHREAWPGQCVVHQGCVGWPPARECGAKRMVEKGAMGEDMTG